MRGKLLEYSAETGEGKISGSDGNRYHFKGTDFHGDVLSLIPGTELDYVAGEDGVATDVYTLNAAEPGPAFSQPVFGATKNNIAAGILAIFLGGLGIHKFYLGYSGAGVIMLLCGTVGWFLILPGAVIWLIGFIEGILYLTKTPAEFDELYVKRQRAWF